MGNAYFRAARSLSRLANRIREHILARRGRGEGGESTSESNRAGASAERLTATSQLASGPSLTQPASAALAEVALALSSSAGSRISTSERSERASPCS